MGRDLRTFSAKTGITKVDYHMHSSFSDGESSIEEYVIQAKKLGLEEIALTDHVWRSSDWVEEYVNEIRRLGQKYEFRTLAGLEAKVIDLNGNVDVTKEDMERVDFIMGVVHRFVPKAEPPNDDTRKLSAEEAAELEAELTIKMLENPWIDVIGHPTRTYYKFHYGHHTNKDFPKKSLVKISKEARKMNKPLEYNARLLIKDELLQLYLDQNIPFTIGTDSHSVDGLNNINYEKLARILSDSTGCS